MRMVELTEEMQNLLNESPVCYLATSSEGIPNVVPMGSAAVMDEETIVMAKMFPGKTLDNLKEDPEASLVFNSEVPPSEEASLEDLSSVKAWQIKGTAEIEEEGPKFDFVKKAIGEVLGDMVADMVRCAIVLNIEEIYNVAPVPGEAGEKVE